MEVESTVKTISPMVEIAFLLIILCYLVIRKFATHAKSKSELPFAPTLEGIRNKLCFSESGRVGEVDGKVVKYLDVIAVMARLGKSAVIAYTLVDAEMKMIKGVNEQVSKEEYDLWGTDDNYMIELALQKANLTRA